MKLLFESWRSYASSRIDEAAIKTTVVQTRQDLVDAILLDPDQAISIDGPKGSTKMFGGETPFVLPFDYGEYPMLETLAKIRIFFLWATPPIGKIISISLGTTKLYWLKMEIIAKKIRN